VINKPTSAQRGGMLNGSAGRRKRVHTAVLEVVNTGDFGAHAMHLPRKRYQDLPSHQQNVTHGRAQRPSPTQRFWNRHPPRKRRTDIRKHKPSILVTCGRTQRPAPTRSFGTGTTTCIQWFLHSRQRTTLQQMHELVTDRLLTGYRKPLD
jgi:hypothetical protein